MPETLDAPTGRVPGDHVAWALDGPHDATGVAGRFLHEGVARGERVWLVDGHGQESRTTHDVLRYLPGADALLARGQLLVTPAEQTYAAITAGDPGGQTELFQAAASEAVHDGYSGLRVWADVTALSDDETALAHFLDYELLNERTFRECPVTGMCALDTRGGNTTWQRMACRHRIRRGPDRLPLFAVELHEDVVHVVGELDVSGARTLRDCLDDITRLTSGDLAVDLGSLDFLDVSGARTISRFACSLAQAGRQVALTGVDPLQRKVLRLFPMPAGALA